jgi:hypothetical protein
VQGEIFMTKLTLLAIAVIVLALGGAVVAGAMSGAGQPAPVMISMVGL